MQWCSDIEIDKTVIHVKPELGTLKADRNEPIT